ncbi:MAG: MFS transporter, partial [Candidatus Binatia bacterium]
SGLLSIVFGRLADRHGRRRMLLFTILAYTVTTAATGFSRGITEFVVFQLFATIFLVTELSLAQVVITEEFPASFRARGQGFLGAFAALGAGMAALLFPIFQETALGWRGLYFVGIFPLLLIAWLRRAMPETRRWHAAHSAGETERFRLADLLAPAWRLRFLVLLAVATAATTAIGPAFAFASYRATKAFAWTPSQVSAMILLGGGVGICGWFVFGWLAERLGRGPVGVIGSVGGAVAVMIFYQTSWLFPAFALLVFMEAGAQIALNAFGTELFPTGMRSTAKAWITNAWIIGAMIGLAVVGLLSEPLGGVEGVVSALGLAPVITSPLLLLLPEPRGRELEELSAAVGPAPKSVVSRSHP